MAARLGDAVTAALIAHDHTYYSPRRLRALLRAYADLLEPRRSAEGDPVRGNRPAWMTQEDQLVKRADVAGALRWLYDQHREYGRAVALAHGLDVTPAGDVVTVGDPDTPRRLARTLSAAEIAWRIDPARTPHHPGALARSAVRVQVKDIIDLGLELMAARLGWTGDAAESEED